MKAKKSVLVLSLCVGLLSASLVAGPSAPSVPGALETQAEASKTPKLILEGYDPTAGKFLVEGQEVRVRVEGGTLTKLTVVYRPKSKVEAKEELGVESADGSLRWAPKDAGLVSLSAEYQTSSGKAAEDPVGMLVSVAFASTFTMGLLVMAFAGILLFGGAFVSIRALLRGEGKTPE